MTKGQEIILTAVATKSNGKTLQFIAYHLQRSGPIEKEAGDIAKRLFIEGGRK